MAKKTVYTDDSKAAKKLAQNLQILPEGWVMCRDVMHAWAVLNDFHAVGKITRTSIILRELICMRCETIRKEEFQMTKVGLDKVHQSYSYPQGYQIPGVPRGVKPKAIVQQESYRRAMERVANAAAGETERAER